MRKKRSIKSQLKRNATNSAKQMLYMMMWGEAPPKGKKRVKKIGDGV